MKRTIGGSFGFPASSPAQGGRVHSPQLRRQGGPCCISDTAKKGGPVASRIFPALSLARRWKLPPFPAQQQQQPQWSKRRREHASCPLRIQTVAPSGCPFVSSTLDIPGALTCAPSLPPAPPLKTKTKKQALLSSTAAKGALTWIGLQVSVHHLGLRPRTTRPRKTLHCLRRRVSPSGLRPTWRSY